MIEDIKWYGPMTYQQQTCPRCGSSDVFFGGVAKTLVGWLRGKDPNHHRQSAQCTDCKFDYTREWVPADDNTWATVRLIDGTVYTISGHPSCCKSKYLVPCSCSNWAKNRQHGKVVVGTRNEKGEWTQNPANIWECSTCGYEGNDMPMGKACVDRS